MGLLLSVFIFFSFTITGLSASSTSSPQTTSSSDQPQWPPRSKSILGNYSKAAVAADNGVCSEIGHKVLQDGGNAVDAAVATMFCIGVTDPQNAGLGGGHLMTIYHKKTRSCFIIDAQGTAPSSARPGMFADKLSSNAKTGGWKSISIPGELYGLRKAYEIAGSGKVQWRDLIRPTIDLCRNGIVVSSSLADAISSKKQEIMSEPTMKDLFFNLTTGQLYQEGEIMKRPVLADTLEQLANSPDPIGLFYRGKLTDLFIQDFSKQTETMITREDFANYTARMGPKERPAITASIDEKMTVCAPPPPSAAAVAIAILKVMQGFNLSPQSIDQPETYHRFLEATKYAFAVRDLLADPDFFPSTLETARNLTSDAFAREIRNRITDTASNNVSHYYILPQPAASAQDHGTTHISILDAEGNAVSLTSTINNHFGSVRRSTSTGIIWNDDLDNFPISDKSNDVNYAPAPYNDIAPGKRHLSAMSPLVVYDNCAGEVQAVAGAAGGLRILSTVASVLMRVLWMGQDPKEAVDAPRLHNQLHPLTSEYEKQFPKSLITQLGGKGQNLTGASESAVACVIARQGGRILANSDFRKPAGYPAGYNK